jgi:hypothetical protein
MFFADCLSISDTLSYCRKILNLWAGKPGTVHSLCKMRWTRGMQPISGYVCINGAARPVNWQNAEADRLKTPHPRRVEEN